MGFIKVISSERSRRLAIAYGSVHVSSLAIGLFGDPPLCATARAKVGAFGRTIWRIQNYQSTVCLPVSRIGCQRRQRRKPMRSSSAAMLQALEILPSSFPLLSRSRIRFRPEQGSSPDIAIGDRTYVRPVPQWALPDSQLHTRQSRNAVIIRAANHARAADLAGEVCERGEPLEAMPQAIFLRPGELQEVTRAAIQRQCARRYICSAARLSRSGSSAKLT